MAKQRVQFKAKSKVAETQKVTDNVADSASSSILENVPSEASVGTIRTTFERSSKGAALEWLLMLVLVVYAAWLVDYYQMGQLPPPLSAADAGKRGFSEESAMTHLKALVSYGPRPVGSEPLELALQYVLSELYDIKEGANIYIDVEIDYFHPSPGVLRLNSGLFKGKSLIYTNLKYPVVRLSPAGFPDAKDNALLISSHIDTVITS